MRGLPALLTWGTAAAEDPAAAPKTLLVFAHPDDETFALGARMGRFAQAHFVHVTDGAPRNERDSRARGFAAIDDYRRARREEFRHMLMTAGVAGARCDCLEVPDQEASLCLAQLTRRLEYLLDQTEPELVLTHPYEGGHPDHDACAFAAHHAVERRRSRGKATPLIGECAFYHAADDVADGGVESRRFLHRDDAGDELVYALSPSQSARRRELLACFATQQWGFAPSSMECERFRLAPRYDFRRPPHEGMLFYERFPLGMSGGRFCELARQAEESLRQELVA